MTEINFDVLERVAREAEPGRRNKNRRGKKGKQGKKGKKANKNKKKNGKKNNKKSGKKNKKNGKKGKGNRSSCRQVATDDACITNICDAWKMRNGPVRNFIRQTKRMVNHAAISEKKLAKKAEFDADAATLTSVLGGNASAPACAMDT